MAMKLIINIQIDLFSTKFILQTLRPTEFDTSFYYLRVKLDTGIHQSQHQPSIIYFC